MKIGGQSKYWGKDPYEALERWYRFGADFLMLKPVAHGWFDAQNLRIKEKELSKLASQAKKRNMKILLHPTGLNCGNILLTPSDKAGKPLLELAIKNIDKQISRYNLMKLLPIHPPTIRDEKYLINGKKEITEEEGLKNSDGFYKTLAVSLTNELLIENTSPFDKAGKNLLLGYNKKQLKLLYHRYLLDLGHVKLSKLKYRGLDIGLIHLHTNDGLRDRHKLMEIKQIKKQGLEQLLLKVPVVIEIKSYNYSDKKITDYIRNLRKIKSIKGKR